MRTTHTAGPWQTRAIPGHLFEIANAAGEIVLRIRGGIMPTFQDARLLGAAAALYSAVADVADGPHASSCGGEQGHPCGCGKDRAAALIATITGGTT